MAKRIDTAGSPAGVILNWTTLRIVLALLVVAAGGVGYWKMQQHVDQTLAFPTNPSRVILKNVPEWMTDQTSDAIARSIAPKVQRSALDAQFLRDIADVLAVNPWVKKVNRVRRLYGESAGDTIEIECEYRVPSAFVHYRDEYILVDADACRLPEKFPVRDGNPRMMFTEDGRLALRIIDGVGGAAPQPGKKWEGEDLAAGLDMTHLLFGQRCAESIEKINVGNYKGRIKPREAQIVLVTKEGTQIRWGEAPRLSFFAELKPAQNGYPAGQDPVSGGGDGGDGAWTAVACCR
ncbi:MAG: hypothetical protein ABSH20_20045 [Tepidisphaeraceae bacterium]